MSSINSTSSWLRSSWSANVRSIMYSGIGRSYSRVSARRKRCSDRGQPVPVRVGGGFGAVGAARLAQDAAHVVRGRVLADRQRAPDLPVAEALRDEAQDLHLARGETVRPVRLWRGRAECADPAQQPRHADALGQRRRLAEQRSGPRTVATLGEEEAPVL